MDFFVNIIRTDALQRCHVFIQRAAERFRIRAHGAQTLCRDMPHDRVGVFAFLHLEHGHLQRLLLKLRCRGFHHRFHGRIVCADAELNICIRFVQISLLLTRRDDLVDAALRVPARNICRGQQRFGVLVQRHHGDDTLKAVEVQPHAGVDVEVNIACGRAVQMHAEARQTDQQQTCRQRCIAQDGRFFRLNGNFLPDLIATVRKVFKRTVVF